MHAVKSPSAGIGMASSFSGQDFCGGNGPGAHLLIPKSGPSSGRWHKPTRCGDRNTSMVELLKLVIDILVFVGKNFIFQETTLFFVYTMPLIVMSTEH